MKETPNPTIAEIRAERSLHTGRVSIAQREIVRRLNLLLPGTIADFNAEEGLSPKTGVQMLSSIEAAPAIVSDSFLGANASGKGFVSMSVATSAFSAGAAYRNDVMVSVIIIDAPIQSENQNALSWERIELVREVLFLFMDNCVDDKGRLCWKILEPTGYSRLGEEIKKYSGVVATFAMLQAPGAKVFPTPL